MELAAIDGIELAYELRRPSAVVERRTKLDDEMATAYR
jgi:hypothetical protein